MTDFLADSNVLLDVATEDPVWEEWSQRQLDDAWRVGRVVTLRLITLRLIAPML